MKTNEAAANCFTGLIPPFDSLIMMEDWREREWNYPKTRLRLNCQRRGTNLLFLNFISAKLLQNFWLLCSHSLVLRREKVVSCHKVRFLLATLVFRKNSLFTMKLLARGGLATVISHTSPPLIIRQSPLSPPENCLSLLRHAEGVTIEKPSSAAYTFLLSNGTQITKNNERMKREKTCQLLCFVAFHFPRHWNEFSRGFLFFFHSSILQFVDEMRWKQAA